MKRMALCLILLGCTSVTVDAPWKDHRYAYPAQEAIPSAVVEAVFSCEGLVVACPTFKWLMVERTGRLLSNGASEVIPLRVDGADSFGRRSGDRLTVLDWRKYRE